MVPLSRALSKLGLLSRAAAIVAIRQGRVRIAGRIVSDPSALVVPERLRVEIDGIPQERAEWRTLVFHKPRGVVTTHRDPGGRPTVLDTIGTDAAGLIAVGRLDMATTGLLLLTNDTRLADWITDPRNAVRRVYLVSVRGALDDADMVALQAGVRSRGETLKAAAAVLRKRSQRESHVTVELREGRNREVRRMFEVLGHEVTRLKRVSLGGLELGSLPPAAWRPVSAADVRRAFPGAETAYQPRRRSKPAVDD